MKTAKSVMIAVVAIAMAVPVFQGCKKGANDPFLSLHSRKSRLAGDWTVSSYAMSSSTTTENPDPDTQIPGNKVKDEKTTSENYNGTTLSSSSTSTITYDNGDNDKTEVTKDASGYSKETTQTTGGVSTTTTYSGDYTGTLTYSITINKDGTWSENKIRNEVTSLDSTDTGFILTNEVTVNVTEALSGTWSFIGKDKTNDFKNKQRVAFWVSSNATTTTTENKDTYTDTDSTDPIDWTTNNKTTSSKNVVNDSPTNTDPYMFWEITELKNKEMIVEVTTTISQSGTTESSTTQGSTTSTSTNDYTTTGSTSGTYTLTQN